MHAEMTTARIVRQEVDLLEVKVQEAVASLEKKEMEAKHLQQQKEAQARYRDQANVSSFVQNYTNYSRNINSHNSSHLCLV